MPRLTSSATPFFAPSGRPSDLPSSAFSGDSPAHAAPANAPGLRRRALLQASLHAGVLGGAAMAGAGPAWAQHNVLRFVVPSPPGGSSDVVARLLAPHLSKSLNKTVVVENRPGASGTIAMRAVETAPADAQVVGLYPTTTMMGFVLQGTEPALNRITPISQVFEQYTLFAVNPAMPGMANIRNMKDFIAAARASAQPINYASPAPGSISHLTTERLCNLAGIQLQHVAYKSAPQVVTDLLGGQLGMAALDMTTLAPHVQAGKLRAIGVNYPQRIAQLPQVPTLAELGFADLASVVAWMHLVGPANMPADQVQAANQAVQQALADPAIHKRMNELYALPKGSTPQEAKALMQRDLQYWRKVMGDNRISGV